MKWWTSFRHGLLFLFLLHYWREGLAVRQAIPSEIQGVAKIFSNGNGNGNEHLPDMLIDRLIDLFVRLGCLIRTKVFEGLVL
jgi:hypothetical protein